MTDDLMHKYPTIQHENKDIKIVPKKDMPLIVETMDKLLRNILAVHSDVPTEYYAYRDFMAKGKHCVDLTYHRCCGIWADDIKLLNDIIKNTLNALEYDVDIRVCPDHTKIGKVGKINNRKVRYEGNECMTIKITVEL